MHIGDGFGNEHIHIQGSKPRMYHSLQEYLQIMSLPSAYAGCIEIAAAQQLYGLNIVVVIAGNASLPLRSNRRNIRFMCSFILTLCIITLPSGLLSGKRLLHSDSFLLHHPRTTVHHSGGGSCIYLRIQSFCFWMTHVVHHTWSTVPGGFVLHFHTRLACY